MTFSQCGRTLGLKLVGCEFKSQLYYSFLFPNLLVTTFLQQPFFATTLFSHFGSLFGNRFFCYVFFHAIFSLYSESCVLGTDQKCPDYQGFLNFQVSYILRDTLGALPSVQIMLVSSFSSVLIIVSSY